MRTKVIAVDELKQNTESIIRECCDSGRTLVVELSDRRRVALQASDEDGDLIDRLIETNQSFRDLLAKSAASGTKPFPFRTKKKPTSGRKGKKK